MDVEAFGADEVIVATGSRPARAGFQRALPMADRLPGVDGPGVVASTTSWMARRASRGAPSSSSTM